MFDRRKVFLSHSSVDKALARRLANDLVAAGFDVWLDQWVIGVGDTIEELVERGVDEADFVIVLLTTASVQSNWVEREWRRKFEDEARRQRIALIPVRGELCEIPDFLSQRSRADIIGGSYPLGLRHLIDLLRHYSGDTSPASDMRPDIGAVVDDSDMPQLVPVVFPITVEVGAGLIPHFECVAGRRMLGQRLPALREALRKEFGFVFPAVHFRGVETEMPPFDALIMLDEIPELRLQMKPEHFIAECDEQALTDIGIAGTPCSEPGLTHWCWIEQQYEHVVRSAGVGIRGLSGYLLAVIREVMASNAAMFMDIDTAMLLVSNCIAKGSSAKTQGLPETISWIEFTEVLQQLVAERISIASLRTIIEAIEQHLDELPDVVALAEHVRHALRNQISRRLGPRVTPLPIVSLHPSIENLMNDAIKPTGVGPYFDLSAETAQQILAACRRVLSAPELVATRPVILVEQFRIRRYLRKLIELEFPSIPVYARDDLNPSVDLHALAQIRVADGLVT